MPRPDPAWLDRQYNNRARVPDHSAIFERGARASALAREGSRCHLDLPYGSGPNETLDVFRSPASDANASVLVFVHGGWRIGRLNPLHWRFILAQCRRLR